MSDIFESCGFDGPEDAARLEAELEAEFPELGERYDLAMTRALRRLRRDAGYSPSLTGSPLPRVEPVERPVGHPLGRRGNNDGDGR